MGYQALLFCPDEKLARVVSQVFSELDFSVEPVQEPFAAVKKLMAQRYDAIVVDCENEQNASLLFKSARNSSFNQSSLAIALVEGQAGVAKAYRIGANLVFTKPINVEQAKGTLRVARGLLRKNSDAASTSTASPAPPTAPVRPAPVSASTSFQPASQGAGMVAAPTSQSQRSESQAPPSMTMQEAAPSMTATASAKVEEKPAVVPTPALQAPAKISAGSAVTSMPPALAIEAKGQPVKEVPATVAASVPAQKTSSTSTAGSAATPAPAKEAPAAPAKQSAKVEVEPANTAQGAVIGSVPSPSPAISIESPKFAALDEESSSGSGGAKKVLIAVVVILALAALVYFGYEKFGKSATGAAPQPISAPQNSGQPAPALRPTSTPEALLDDRAGRASLSTEAPASKTASAALSDKPGASAANSPVIRIASTPEAETKKPASAPIVVKANPVGTKTQAPADDAEPQLPSPPTVVSANDNLSGLMPSASSNLPRPRSPP